MVKQIDDAQEIRGGTDATIIGNNANRLLVDAELSTTAPLDQPRIDQGENLSLNNNSGAWVNITNFTGAGVFYGGVYAFDNESVSVRLLINGVVQWTIDCSEFDNLYTDHMQAARIYWETADEKLMVNWPTRFTTSFNIQARASDGNNNRDLDDWITWYGVTS